MVGALTSNLYQVASHTHARTRARAHTHTQRQTHAHAHAAVGRATPIRSELVPGPTASGLSEENHGPARGPAQADRQHNEEISLLGCCKVCMQCVLYTCGCQSGIFSTRDKVLIPTASSTPVAESSQITIATGLRDADGAAGSSRCCSAAALPLPAPARTAAAVPV